MMTKTLKLAMNKATKLPTAIQEQIGRDLLERLEWIVRLKSDLELGIRQLDADMGVPLDICDVIRAARIARGE
jgi:hypothetical protein